MSDRVFSIYPIMLFLYDTRGGRIRLVHSALQNKVNINSVVCCNRLFFMIRVIMNPNQETEINENIKDAVM